MSEDYTISTLRPGIVLQGHGGVDNGATVLQHKQADNYTDVVLCLAPLSTYDPFVVWTYRHDNGRCYQGEYFRDLQHALNAYEEREF